MSSMNVRREGQQGSRNNRDTVCFSVTAEADPSVMSRVFGLFAKRGVMPERYHAQVSGDGELHIDIQMAGLEDDEAEKYAQSMRQVFCVERVLTSFKQIAEDAPA